jgi:D-alanine-D-alanine ligase
MKNIAVVCGGNSSEYEVSLKSGKNIYESIDRKKFTPWMVRIRFDEWVVIVDGKETAIVDKGTFSFTVDQIKIVPDYIFLMIHGTPGENGILQGYFDTLTIPYSSTGVYASALTFHKFYCDNFLRALGIIMAKADYYQRGDDYNTKEIVAKFGLPLFIKPSAGGSSFGVTKVKKEEDIPAAMEAAYAESDDCLIEEFIDGMELAVGVCDLNGEIVPFLPTEVIPKGEFFDYDSKYLVGGALEITPARLPQDKIVECQALTKKLYKLIGCHGIVRIDYILKNNIFYFLEINTIPGMTETSFIPQQLNAMNLKLTDVVTQIIEHDLLRC